MAAVYLIRHGQASFGKADYDQLSDKGTQQANILGKHWQQLTTPDKIYSGDLLRHEQTTENFLIGLNQGDFPVVTHSGFNEFNHIDVLTRYKPEWQNYRVMNAYLVQQADPKIALHLEFNNALKRWISDDFQDEYQESWQQFKTRCVNALNEIITQELAKQKRANNPSKANNILVFTSGGPISVIIQHILMLTDQQGLMINQQLRNTGVTKLLFSGDRLSVDYFNNYSHLDVKGDDWLTFR